MILAAKILYLVAIPFGIVGLSGLVLVAIVRLPVSDTTQMGSFIVAEGLILGGFGLFASLVLRL